MIDTKDPKFLAFWTKTLRETNKWSQEALAVSSGLDVRTIQRIEAGKTAVSVTTRRMLAKGLGYDNPDVFDDPKFIEAVQGVFDEVRKAQEEEQRKKFPDHIRIAVARTESGEGLSRLAYETDTCCFHADEEIPEEAKEIAVGIFDYLRDLGDLGDDIPFSERLGYQRSLGEYLQQLEAAGAACYCALRSVKAVGANWVDKTPMPWTVGYLTVVPAGKALTEMMVPKRLS